MTEEKTIEEVNVTIDQDDIDEVREKGFIVRDGVVFYDGNPDFYDTVPEGEDDYKRHVILSPTTLYREGEAVWPISSPLGEVGIEEHDVRVVAEYERPSIGRFIESELKDSERLALRSDNRRDEYWLGSIRQLDNLEGWIKDD